MSDREQLASKQATFIDKEDVLNFLGELMADYVDREQLGKADLVGDAIKLITAVEPVAQSSNQKGWDKWPERIYLQRHEDDVGDSRYYETSWCQDKINETDVEYVRADRLLAEPVAPLSPPADHDQEPSRADKLRAALEPAGVKVTVLGEDEAIERLEQQKKNLLNALEAKQARIDALMLEYCPGEMSASQRAAWSASQELASVPPAASQVEEVLCAGVVVSSPHDRRITLRFETDEQFRAAEVLIGIADCQVIDTAVTKSAGDEHEPADSAECVIYGNGSGNRCVTHGTTWVDGVCPATLGRGAVETEATPVECPKSPTQFHVTKIGGQVCVYCGPVSEEGSQ